MSKRAKRLDEPRRDSPIPHVERGLGSIEVNGIPYPARLRLRRVVQLCPPREALVALDARERERLLVIAHPLILEPDGTGAADVACDAPALPAPWFGLRYRRVGQALGWCYPRTRAIVLWECYLHATSGPTADPADPALAIVWAAFERALTEQFPTATRLLTPANEALYPLDPWHRFLTTQGYQRVSPSAFGKEG